MTEFKNTQQQLSKFRFRVAAAGLFVLVCFGLLIGCAFCSCRSGTTASIRSQAEENRISVAPIVPNRGIITDRNGVVLARNYSAYTLEITPSKLNTTLDQVIDQLATVVTIDQRDRRRFKKLLEDSKNFESLPIRTRLTDEEVARFTAQRFRFPGVDVRARLFRQYPLGSTAAHVIGYIGRISQRDQEKIDAVSEQNDSDPDHYDPRLDANNYKGTDYIGKIGVEQSYEAELHGLTGFEEVEVTAGGRPVRTLSRTQATPGNNLVLSLDIGLQEVAEQAFAGKRGALVAIEPSTGDVLAFVSAPSFDPNAFVDGIDQQTWDELNNSPDHPLLNRPLHSAYPPGSTYKPFMALAALTLHKRTPEWGFHDPGFYHVRRTHVPQRRAAGPRLDRHEPRDHGVERHLLLYARARSRCRCDRQVHEAVGLRADYRHRHRRRVARYLAVDGMEEEGIPQAGTSSAGMRARRSASASAKATTRSRCCSSRTPRRRWPTTASSCGRTSSRKSKIRLRATCGRRCRMKAAESM